MPQISPRSCRIGGLPRGEGGERGVKRDERGGYLGEGRGGEGGVKRGVSREGVRRVCVREGS